jgi:diaminopimelate decarboxylase
MAAEVLVNGGKFDVIRERKTIEDLIAADTVPDWLK